MHHSEKPDGTEALKELMNREALSNELGETGNFPNGKITETDEGEIRFGVACYGSQILLNFGKPVAWFAMDAEQAESLGEILIKKAKETKKYLVGIK